MMIEVFMNREEATRLSDLLKEIRGDQTVRSFCSNIEIHRAAWQTWEKMDSAPMRENLERIAALKGWNLDELTSYLRTGDIKKPAYTAEQLLSHGRNLPLEERVKLARQLLAD
jgi:hypothetical protein